MAKKNDVPLNTAYSSGVQKVQVVNDDNLLTYSLEKEITFVAGTTGAVAVHDLLTITGAVSLSIIAVNTGGSTLTGATATIETGTALSTAGLLAQVLATTFDSKEIWHDATVDSSIELSSVMTQKIVTQDVSYKIATAAITGGVLTFYIRWSPISLDGNVALA